MSAATRWGVLYLAEQIDLNPDKGWHDGDLSTELAHYSQLAVFRPKAAWELAADHVQAAVSGLCEANQKMAMEAECLVAVVDLTIPTWGVPIELFSRIQYRHDEDRLATFILAINDPGGLPLVLQWMGQLGVIFVDTKEALFREIAAWRADLEPTDTGWRPDLDD